MPELFSYIENRAGYEIAVSSEVYFISVGSWSNNANISGFPWWIFFGFFANERQHFETNKIRKKFKKVKQKDEK